MLSQSVPLCGHVGSTWDFICIQDLSFWDISEGIYFDLQMRSSDLDTMYALLKGQMNYGSFETKAPKTDPVP